MHWFDLMCINSSFKVACLLRQSLSSLAPLYLADDCSCRVSDSTRRSLRSADVPTCVVPRTLSSYGDNFCSRCPSGPAAQFSHHLRTVQTIAEGTPFSAAWTRCSVTSDMWRLTYLLTKPRSLYFFIVILDNFVNLRLCFLTGLS